MKILPWQQLTDMFTRDDMCTEMNKKFRNTIMCLTIDNKKHYCQYNGYKTHGGKVVHLFSDEEECQITVNHDTEVEVTIPNPRRGLYNTTTGLVLFQRLPFRQHKRGLYNETASIIKINDVMAGIGLAGKNRFYDHIFEVLDASCQKPLALDLAKDGCDKFGSVAINREFGLTLHPKKDQDFALLYEDCYVGEVIDKTILVKNPIFHQEVIDSYEEWAPNYSVRLAV